VIPRAAEPIPVDPMAQYLSLEHNIGPEDSVSQLGTENLQLPQENTNPMENFLGLEGTLLQGMFTALPKPSHGIVANNLTEAVWFHMRGFGTDSDKWPKADQISKAYTAESAPAFRPPPPPLELPMEIKPQRDADELLMRR
jgi:hypothetical protein